MSSKPHYEKAFFKLIYSPAIFEFTSRLFGFLGRGFYVFVARSVAWTYAVTQRDVREIVRKNLELLTKEPMRDRDAVRVFTTYGSTIADYVAVGNMDQAKAAKLCAELHGAEHLEEAKRAGRGAILATGHFGFFEYGALLLAHMGHPVTVVTLSEHTRELTEWRANFRRRWGAETIEVGPDAFSSLRIFQTLSQGGFAAMLADRPVGGPAVPVELPNGRIAFSSSPALIAWMADCPVIPVTVTRRADGCYRIVSKPCIWPRRMGEDNREKAVEIASRKIADSLFEEIVRSPHQWYQFIPLGL
ncbi:MAG: lysophospholipid acyltransferase family protein [Chthoniobacterales bacterium]